MTLNGYECQTTFWQDFAIAELFGENAVQDTYSRAVSEWKSNRVFITGLVMVLNHRAWFHYGNHNMTLCDLYSGLYYEAYEVAITNLTGDDLAYFFQTTD